MNRSIDFRSALMGGLLAALILCLVGAVPYMSPEEYGRFRIEINDSHAFVLDSATGQVWSSRFQLPTDIITPNDPNFYPPKVFIPARIP